LPIKAYVCVHVSTKGKLNYVKADKTIYRGKWDINGLIRTEVNVNNHICNKVKKLYS